MKLKIIYRKLADGIEAKIVVLDKEDFLTPNIFTKEENADFSVFFFGKEIRECFELGEKYSYIACSTFDTPFDAEKQADHFINRIKEALDKWRQIEVPNDREITI